MAIAQLLRVFSVSSLTTFALLGCGGSDPLPDAQATVWGDPAAARSATLPELEKRKILGVAVGAANAGANLTYIERFFDWAESVIPQYLPGHSTTLVEGPWYYRSYFSTGIMFGVNAGSVYVVGGTFGSVPIRVGQISDFIGPMNSAPVANAGSSQSVSTGSFVTLDGSRSSDSNGDRLTYSWQFTSRPAGSSAFLSGSNTARPSFIADVSGAYVVRLVVNDGTAASTPSTVTVTASTASLFCGNTYGSGTDGLQLYTPDNNFTYNLSSTAASSLDLVTLTWGARYTAPSTSYTGSLKASLWAVRAPYTGGLISGTVLGEFIPTFTGSGAYSQNQLIGGGYSTNTISSSTSNYNPAAGQYCLVLTLLQYMPGQCTPSQNGYCVVDWLQFSTPVTFR